MTSDNALDTEPVLFRALLTPHRSLGPAGFLIVMILFGGISFVGGLLFLIKGAWPVFGFFGLDVLLLYVAFRINFARAAAYEEIAVTFTEVRIRKVSHRGAIAEWTFNPLWLRLERDTHFEFGIERLYLRSRGRELTIADCLGPDEKESFAAALTAALAAARRGPNRNPALFAER